ncbi:MAG: hypothetical protein V1767_01370 [Chloroflexota bacterium]
MRNNSRREKRNIACHRCGNIIKPGEKMITIAASLETPRRDGSIELLEVSTVSSVCSSCASILSSELDILASEARDDAGKATLKVHCSEQGLQFILRCSDGIAWANSRLFTWNQIAQLLISADPDMFGVLDEPLHQVFPENLKLLGYYVPNCKSVQEKAKGSGWIDGTKFPTEN